MDTAELQALVDRGESQGVEFKEAWPPAETISRVICSLANTHGGLLIIGVDDVGHVVGIQKQNVDKLQQTISAANRAISPLPIVSVSVEDLNGKLLVIVGVQRALDNVYYTYQGAIFVRIGSTTQRLEGQSQLDFLRNRQILSFDETYDPSATLEDIDPQRVIKYLQSRGQPNYLNTHSLEDFLINNKLANRGEEFKIKNSTLILFGKDPTLFHPQVEIKLVQFAGTEPVDILDYKLVKDDMVSSIEQVMAFVMSKISRRVVITNSAKREDEYEYPISVIREAVVNAIIHRDYFSKDSIQISIFNNRLEITSPGTLPSALSKELFGTLSVQRNPIMYRFLRDLGYVEGLGTGIPRMRSEMRKAGLPEPKYQFTDEFVRITLMNGGRSGRGQQVQVPSAAPAAAGEVIERLNERQIKALKYLETQKKLKAQKYSDMNKVSYATAVNEINNMINLKLLKKVGQYRGAYYILRPAPQEPV